MYEELTYQWLTPLLIGMIVALLGMIGAIGRSYLQSISSDIADIKKQIKENVLNTDRIINELRRENVNMDKRMTRLEDHANK